MQSPKRRGPKQRRALPVPVESEKQKRISGNSAGEERDAGGWDEDPIPGPDDLQWPADPPVVGAPPAAPPVQVVAGAAAAATAPRAAAHQEAPGAARIIKIIMIRKQQHQIYDFCLYQSYWKSRLIKPRQYCTFQSKNRHWQRKHYAVLWISCYICAANHSSCLSNFSRQRIAILRGKICFGFHDVVALLFEIRSSNKRKKYRP